ncbi:MAG: ABC transporter permease [Spirochaetes bacterium]|nr:ABC transporter permease [Spirochaetota bacterium]
MNPNNFNNFNKKNNLNYISVLINTIIIFLVFIGTTMYMASYFSGVIFIILSVILYFIYKLKYEQEEERSKIVKKWIKSISLPLIGIGISVIIGGIIMFITGYDPFLAYRALFYGGFYKNWHVSVLNAVPLIFTGLSISIAFQAGLFNIGAEGQYYIGAIMAAFLGLYLNLPPFFSILLIFILGGLSAALYNFIPAFLKVKTGAHEVITTMMLAHIARLSSPMFIRLLGGQRNINIYTPKTDDILINNRLPRFADLTIMGNKIFENTNYRVHIGILIAIICAILVYIILYYTKLGFEIRSVGLNKNASKVAGISSGRITIISLMFAGFLAGLSGVVQVTGLDYKLFENLEAGYGWNGISVALLASNNPIGVIFTALLWGALNAGGQYMSRTTQIPNSIVEIIKGIILFLVVARYLYNYVTNRLIRKSNI